MSDLPDMAEVAADLKLQTDRDGEIAATLSPLTALCVIAQIQLASRHPDNTGPALETACDFARMLGGMLPDTAQLLVEAGWNPENDK